MKNPSSIIVFMIQAVKRLHELSVKLDIGSNARDMLMRCATTCLSSKLVSTSNESQLLENVDLRGIEKNRFSPKFMAEDYQNC